MHRITGDVAGGTLERCDQEGVRLKSMAVAMIGLRQ